MAKQRKNQKPIQPQPEEQKQHSEETREKISKSMIGNLNAEKYSLEEAIKLFSEALIISTDKEFDFIGEVASQQGLYKDLYNHLLKRFPELTPIFNNIKNNLESNCYHNGKKGNIIPSLAIINLKSNHGWTDRIESKSDITTGGKPITLKDLVSFEDSEDLDG